MKILALSITVALTCGWNSLALAREKLQLQAEWSSKPSDPDLINIQILEEDDSWYEPSIFTISSLPEMKDPKQYTVTASKNGKDSTLKISKVILHPDESTSTHANRLSLVLASPPDKDSKFKVSWKPGTFKVVPENGDTVKNKDGPLDVQGNVTKHLTYAHPLPDNELSLKQGEDFGAWSFRYFYSTTKVLVTEDGEPGAEKFQTTQQYNLHLGIKSAGTFQSADENKYLDQFEAELGGYWVDTIYRHKPMLGNWGIVEFGFSTKLQADQDFDMIDQTFGANAWFYLHNKTFDDIHRFFRFYDGKRGTQGYHETALPPVIKFGYDYVTNLQENDPTSKETGHNRFDGSFYWSLPLARNVEIKGIPLIDQIKQVNFITDLACIYDIDKSNFSPEVNLSVDFAITDSDKAPKISLSWINGKTAPKFEHFDAFLAGFKMKL